MHWYSLVAAILPGVALIVSEILPFTKGKANGILHWVLIALQEGQKAGGEK